MKQVESYKRVLALTESLICLLLTSRNCFLHYQGANAFPLTKEQLVAKHLRFGVRL